MNLEVWKSVKGYDGLYLVSNLGRIRSLYKRTFNSEYTKLLICKKGYLHVNLYKNKKIKRFNVHRIVCEAFIPNPENKPQVNHINGIKTDNRVYNLEWATAKENIIHAHKNKLKTPLKGENCSWSKITKKDVIAIINSKDTQKTLSLKYNISQSQISRIKNKQRWV